MTTEAEGTAAAQGDELFLRSYCSAPQLSVASPARNAHYVERVARQRRVLNIITWLAAVVSAAFAVLQLVTERGIWYIGVINLVAAAVFAGIPLLHRFGHLIAPLVLIAATYVSLSVVCMSLGTGTGLQFYFVVVATVAVLVLGIEHVVLASVLVGIGVALVITLQFTVPADTGVSPPWSVTTGFVVSIISACGMAVAAVWYALRETERAEEAMELEYERSESLLANILPATIAARLKTATPAIIADRYADASVLFADIAGYTERASETTPADLVQFLNELYSEFDRLVEQHGLEKIKTSGDCYIVVSGVPQPRHDHLEALACLALKMAEAVGGMIDATGRTVPVRIGLGCGPVVAGVVGTRRFFYDVWGDAVNVASRMESTGVEGKIQVTEAIRHRLNSEFVLEERGEVTVKGKGVMRTWFLIAQRDGETHFRPGLRAG